MTEDNCEHEFLTKKIAEPELKVQFAQHVLTNVTSLYSYMFDCHLR